MVDSISPKAIILDVKNLTLFSLHFMISRMDLLILKSLSVDYQSFSTALSPQNVISYLTCLIFLETKG